MTSRAGISRNLREARKRLKTWKAVSQELFDGEINGTILSRIANADDDYWPVDKDILSIINPARIVPDDEIAKRTLVIHSTKPELHKIQEKFSPRERTEKLLEATK